MRRGRTGATWPRTMMCVDVHFHDAERASVIVETARSGVDATVELYFATAFTARQLVSLGPTSAEASELAGALRFVDEQPEVFMDHVGGCRLVANPGTRGVPGFHSVMSELASGRIRITSETWGLGHRRTEIARFASDAVLLTAQQLMRARRSDDRYRRSLAFAMAWVGEAAGLGALTMGNQHQLTAEAVRRATL